jgi:RHS repeat-associated protein
VILPGGSRRQYVYDPLMRVKSIMAKDPGQNVVMSYQYSYDKMDNITAKATEHGPYEYGYDDIYRLTNADNPVQADEAYSYDGVGNCLTSVEHSDWSYSTNNELQGYDGVMFLYDANGNTIEKNDNGNITKYFYNIEDRLVRVEDGTGTVIATYYYDPFGRRLWKEVDGVRTYFVYSDEGLVGEYDASGTEIRSYGYKPGSKWTTDPLFFKENGQHYFYQNDHLGTPQKITSVSGAEVWSAKYNAFGGTDIEVTSMVTNNLRFAGQYFDEEIGIHYNRHRYYDPKVGRYLRVDPIGFFGGVNLFLYVADNPIKLIDPWGLFHYYKRYGGPNWTAGFEATWDTLPESVRSDIQRQIQKGWDPWSPYAPMDEQDTCYMYHDICCGEARMYCREQEGCYDKCLLPKKNKCDRELVNCNISIGIMGNALDEVRRIAAIPVFILRPATNNAIAENKKKSTNWWLRFEF